MIEVFVLISIFEQECTRSCSSSELVTSTTGSDSSSAYQHVDLKQLVPDSDNKIGLNDNDLANTKIRDLNKRVKQTSLKQEDVEKIKKKRRTMKNRGYAKGSRSKKMAQEKKLDKEVGELKVKFFEQDSLMKYLLQNDIGDLEKNKDVLLKKIRDLEESNALRLQIALSAGIRLPGEK